MVVHLALESRYLCERFFRAFCSKNQQKNYASVGNEQGDKGTKGQKAAFVDGTTAFWQEEDACEAKPFVISKWQVMCAFELVKANTGAAGIDK